ncbi:MAG TPA: DNA-directed RNA polymerase subunit omega [Thermodesulfovibrionia bacterium]|nr:DNA-directed RNA polymerase subunit omega [Thermodesulfovibrionia bacterium]
MDIVTLPIEYDEKKIDGRYRLVVAAAQRAREILLGLYPGKNARGSQSCIMALEEVISDDVEILRGEEAKRLRDKVKRTNYERMIEEASVNQESGVAELSELEKELKVYLTEKGGKEARISLDEIFENKAEE